MDKEIFRPISAAELDDILAWLAGEESFVFLETLRGDADNRYSRIFVRPEGGLVCGRGPEAVETFLAGIGRALAAGRHLAGWIAYEFGYLLEDALVPRLAPDGGPLARLGVFRERIDIDHRRPRPEGAPWAGAADKHLACSVADLGLNLEREAYLRDIKRIKRYIEAGDTYQVNYTLKYRFRIEGSPLALYRRLRRRQSVAYAALIRNGDEWIISLSPELFFRIKDGVCTVKPMKGTCPRGRTLAEDAELAAALAADEKNRAENVMIVDLLRNDLGRICVDGGVRAVSMFDVEPFETLQQMTSTVEGRLAPGICASRVIRALFPCGSVTGAPKLRTMEIISELEREERGVYTGGIGYFSPGGECCFNVPIRTAVIRDGAGEMGIGSGIVYDSDPDAEWRECLLKGNFLTAQDCAFSLIETLLFRKDGGWWLLDGHMARLRESAIYFGFFLDMDDVLARLRGLGDELARGGEDYVRARLLLHRDGGIELGHAPCGAPRLLIDPDGEAQDAAWVAERVDPASRFLFHKTTIREQFDRAFARARREGLFDLLFTNMKGEVTEGAISNIFVLRSGELLTPPVECGLLPGVLRAELLRRGAETVDGKRLPVREAVVRPEDVESAEAVFLGNSVRGLTRVRIVDG